MSFFYFIYCKYSLILNLGLTQVCLVFFATERDFLRLMRQARFFVLKFGFVRFRYTH
jgi:hypothetical protein